MKTHSLLVLFVTSLLFFSFKPLTLQTSSNKTTIHMQKQDSVLRHVVLFKFKADASDDKIKNVEKSFKALPSKIPQIISYEWGLNNSPEGLSKGFTHCFFLTFKNEEDRAIYLPHPDHKAFGALLKTILDDVLVVDYWTK
tara:strand:+ start:3101 stop:3520 length:420 start_codon:yes stop_codon:yes gene_type:complete